MKLLSPVNSFESVKAQITAGADEIYVGMKTEVYQRYSFSGRGQASKDVKEVVPSKKQLKEIVEFSHENHVMVGFTANTPVFSDSLNEKDKMLTEYLKYIDSGIECGVDHIIVGDIGLLYKLGKMDLPVSIHASTYFDTMNVEQLQLLKELGASRAVLTYQICMEEIEQLCKANIMEIEVFGYLSCSFFNGACNLVHGMGEADSKEENILGIPCKSQYRVWYEGDKEQVVPFFDAELGCALCSLKKLDELGVDVVKIVGRDRNHEMITTVTSLFRQLIDLSQVSDTAVYEMKVKELTYGWWKKLWCSKHKCKYRKNEITDSYIGYD